jgi:hypothetical protein
MRVDEEFSLTDQLESID